MIATSERSRMIRTERRMPIPENTTVAGENAWGMTIGSLIPGRKPNGD